MSGLGFAIIGVQKGATTSLRNALARHPDTFVPADEDPVFEDPWSRAEAQGHLDQLASEARGRLVGIKRPNYLYVPEVPHRMRDLCPDVHLIVLDRDPVARAVSAYYHYVSYGLVQENPIDVGLQRILRGADLDSFPRAREVVEWGRVGSGLEAWMQVFPPAQILVLDEAQMRNGSGMALACAFLGLVDDPDASPPVVPVSNRGSYSPLRRAALKTGARMAARPDPPSKWVGRAVRSLDARVVSRFVSSKAPEISEETERLLTGYYQDDRRLLARLRPLTWVPERTGEANA